MLGICKKADRKLRRKTHDPAFDGIGGNGIKKPHRKEGAFLAGKTCPVCGSEFDSKTSKQIYCSYKCKDKRRRENRNNVKVIPQRGDAWHYPGTMIKIAEMALEARNIGISYGQYAALDRRRKK